MLFLSSAAHSAEVVRPALGSDTISIDAVVSYLNQGEASQAAINLALAPIKSQSELVSHLAQTSPDNSPLYALSEPARQRFISSLTFGPKGITSFKHDDLEAELTPTQIYQVLSLFGVQQDTTLLKNAKAKTATDGIIMNIVGPPVGQDYEGYRCMEPGSCFRSASWICTHNC